VQNVNNHSIDPDVSVAKTGEPKLTARELQVVRLMADGLTTKRIAGLMQISFKTASSHRGNILKKIAR
jgi:DNA-binding CsgD family transcriptional regulator